LFYHNGRALDVHSLVFGTDEPSIYVQG